MLALYGISRPWHIRYMVRELRMPDMFRPDIARRINDYSASELLQFVKDQIDAKSLHQVVRELNRLVLSNQADSATEAQRALVRIGFTD